MSWFRLRQRCCGWVALLALALQLALSFGHVHRLPTADFTIVASAATPNGAPPQPAGGEHHDDDYCAICTVLALLSGAQTASAPVLPIFTAPPSTEITIASEAFRSDRSRAAFRSRAPPIS
jgi:hypothetical protein